MYCSSIIIVNVIIINQKLFKSKTSNCIGTPHTNPQQTRPPQYHPFILQLEYNVSYSPTFINKLHSTSISRKRQ